MIRVPPPGRIAIGTATVGGQKVEMFLTTEWARYFDSLTSQSDSNTAALAIAGAISSMSDDSGSVMEFIPGPPGPAGVDGAPGPLGPMGFSLEEASYSVEFIPGPPGPPGADGASGGGTGTVTTVSVAAANGFAGTVATATTTPVITLTTSLTGLLKGNGTAMSSAVAGTDYVAPTTTVNGHALSANVTVTASDVGLGSVTNNAQTQAAIVPNTAPAAGRILVGNSGGTAYAPVAMSGDVTIDSAGVATSTGKRRLANVTLAVAGASLASGTITACRLLEIHIFISGYAGSDTASLQFNGAAGTAYRYQWATMAAAATTFTAGLTAASTDRIKVAAVNTTNSRRVVAFISNDSTVTEKLVVFDEKTGTGSAATQATRDMGDGAWVSGAATQITSVSLVSSSNMNAGTQMTIYGWN